MQYTPSRPQWMPNYTIHSADDSAASIFFIAQNQVMSYFRVDDAIFRTEPEPFFSGVRNGVQVEAYAPWHTVAVLSCIEESFLCNPALSELLGLRCLSFDPMSLASSTSNMSRAFTNLRMSPRQMSTAERLLAGSILSFRLGTMVNSMSSPLLASRTVDNGDQVAQLPPGHWRAEVGRWFSINLSLMQAGFVEFAAGPLDPAYREKFVTYDRTGAAEDCASQVFRNAPGVRNFNLTAVIIVIAIGVCLIAVGLAIESLVGWFQRRSQRDDGARLRWLLDGVFQQQRLAYEAAGVEHWRDAAESIPTTDQALFPSIDSRDPLHPRLHHVTQTEVAATQETVSGAKGAQRRMSSDSVFVC